MKIPNIKGKTKKELIAIIEELTENVAILYQLAQSYKLIYDEERNRLLDCFREEIEGEEISKEDIKELLKKPNIKLEGYS